MLQVREYLGATRMGLLLSAGVVLSPEWQMVAMDYVAVAAGSTLDFQVIDYPVASNEVFVTDDVSIFVIAGGNVDVKPGGDLGGRVPLQARLAPSPLRSQSMLSFATSRPGPLQVGLYDVAGRLVRTVLDEQNAAAGLHDLTLDGRDDRGRTLASGLYFYRIRALEGVSHGKVVIAR
jgi:hypothetical protein